MIFREAKKDEAQAINNLYKSVMGTIYCTWDDIYPGKIEIEEDLAADTLFVLERNSEIIGAVSVVPKNEMDAFDCWKARKNTRELARVVISPAEQGKGLSRVLIDGVILELRKTETVAVHISVAKVNIPAIKLYKKYGFDFCGEAYMYGNNYYLCEKML